MPRVVTGLVGLIVLAHVAAMFLAPATLEGLYVEFGVAPAYLLEAARSHPFAILVAPLSHVFLHGGWIHLLFNCFLILQTGELVAERLGRDAGGALRFLTLFFASAAAGAVVYILFNAQSGTPAIGASGAGCGLYGAYLLALAPNWRIAIRAPAIWRMAFFFLAVNVGLALLARASGVLPIAWEAHLGGFVGGVALYPLLAPRRVRRTPWG